MAQKWKEKMRTIDKSWKIQADPENVGKHPLHDCRFITTSDFYFDGANRDDEKIICAMRDLLEDQKEVAQLIAAAPDMIKALKAWDSVISQTPMGQIDKIVCNIGPLNHAILLTTVALNKAQTD